MPGTLYNVRKGQLIYISCILAVLIQSCYSTDLLNGFGSFTNGLKNWSINTTGGTGQTYNVGQSGNLNYVFISKPAADTIDFYDSLYYNISNPTPLHISFYFSSTNVETEQTNLRLRQASTGLTAVSFRCGFAGFVRVNDNQIVTFYNSTVSDPTLPAAIIWNKADLILDWQNLLVNIYINNTSYGNVGFYHNGVTAVDTLALYSLTPGSAGFFSQVQVCNTLCSANAIFMSSSVLTISFIATLILLISLLLV